jgi:hypothetical protein
MSNAFATIKLPVWRVHGANSVPTVEALATIPIPYVVAAAALTAVGVCVWLARRRAARQSRRPPSRAPHAAHSTPGPYEGTPSALSEYWSPIIDPAGEPRSITRREGLTDVLVTGEDGRSPQRGHVVNRTSDGIRLAVNQAVPVGTPLKLRACNAPANTPWADVRVVWCEMMDGRIEVSCQFQGQIPWNVLHLFG